MPTRKMLIRYSRIRRFPLPSGKSLDANEGPSEETIAQAKGFPLPSGKSLDANGCMVFSGHADGYVSIALRQVS